MPRATSTLHAPPAAATTLAPAARASWTSNVPTPPAAASTSTRSPSRNPAFRTSMIAVRLSASNATALSSSRPSGTSTSPGVHRGALGVAARTAGARNHPLAYQSFVGLHADRRDHAADAVTRDHRQLRLERPETARTEHGLHEGDVGERHLDQRLSGTGNRVRGVGRDEHLRPAELL